MATARGEHGEPVELEAAGRRVSISSPAKVMFPEHGFTKLDVARYYLGVEAPIMRATATAAWRTASDDHPGSTRT